MSIVPITNIEYPGNFECLDEECSFRRECAQHRSAGDFRSESGFTPELLIIRNTCYCDTKDKQVGWEEGYPENYDDLPRGALCSNHLGMIVPFDFYE